MKPAHSIDVLDKHNGFTAITKSKSYEKITTETGVFKEWRKIYKEHNTLWRPSYMLKSGTIGILQEYDENSFYQNNNNVTKTIYKVKGYCNRIVLWFDNKTGERIA